MKMGDEDMKKIFEAPRITLVSVSVSDVLGASAEATPAFENQLELWDMSIDIVS